MFTTWIKKTTLLLGSLVLILLLTSCQHNEAILTNVDERDANQIIVLLQSKGIDSTKQQVKTSGAGGGESTATQWDIYVDSSRSVEALAILNRIGLPRKPSTTLLDLFPQQGMMKTDKEEQIRYNEGLNEQLASTIQMIDGVLAAEVQIAFPEVDAFNPDQQIEYPRASVFVKHDGILDDPNNLLVQKIRRYIAGSVLNLRYEDVTVVTDRARFTDINVNSLEPKTAATPWGTQDYVKIWSIVLSEHSASAFRTILFLFCLFMILTVLIIAWMVWKFQNAFKLSGGVKEFFNPKPIVFEPSTKEKTEAEDKSEEENINE